jgi:ribosome-associated toxin RatA of RatAB toxin-antitoxin module
VTAILLLAIGFAAGAPAPPGFDDDEVARLATGETVYRYEVVDGRDGGIAARLVQASADDLWHEILDYDAYVEYLPYVTASSTEAAYPEEAGHVVESSIQLTTRGRVTTYRVRNAWHPDQGYLDFVMTGRGPVKGGTGWWRVDPWPTDGRMLLVYRVELVTAWWVPWFTKRMAARRGLPTVVQLVGERAEGLASTP